MGKGGALSNGVVKKIILSYTYVAVWIFLSFTVIVYNKYILDRKLYNWPFPISLTMIHMAFCSSLAFAAVRIFKLVEPPPSAAVSTFPPSSPSALSTPYPSGSRTLPTSTSRCPSSKCSRPLCLLLSTRLGLCSRKTVTRIVPCSTCLESLWAWQLLLMVRPSTILGGFPAAGGGCFRGDEALKAKEAQKKAQPENEESGKLLEQREGDGMGKKGDSQA
ncbi:UNVERIFIED_CONTAM: putative sugar phosphate/phosphate translocator [Sesamum radiatum]|uniref:Sugar phosphate/phosphate translocator n=1 Tax=Sesamum radiatum TaxID=300843 RepID=A0AAW2KXS8_SESRA